MAQNQKSQSYPTQMDVAVSLFKAGVRVSKLVADQLDPDETNEFQELEFECAAEGCAVPPEGRPFHTKVGYWLEAESRWVPSTLRIVPEGRDSFLVERLRIVASQPLVEGRLNVVCNYHARLILAEHGSSSLVSLYWTLSLLDRIEQEGVDVVREFEEVRLARGAERRTETAIVRAGAAEIAANPIKCFKCGRTVKGLEAFGVHLRELRDYIPQIHDSVRRGVVEAIHSKFSVGGGPGSLPLAVCDEGGDETCREGLQRAITGNPRFSWVKGSDGQRLVLVAPLPEILERIVRSRRNAMQQQKRTEKALASWGELCQMDDDGRPQTQTHHRHAGKEGGKGRSRYHSGGQPG